MRYLLAAILLMTGTANAQESDVREAIEAQNTVYEKGYTQRDADMIAALHTESTTVYPPNRQIYEGHAGVIKMVGEDLAMTQEYVLTLDTQSLEILGDTVIEVGLYTAKLTMTDGKTVINDRGNTMVIWKRQENGSWLMDKDIYNSTMRLE